MDWLASNNERFLFSEELHDVVFQFVNKDSEVEVVETLPGHALILAFASDVFRTQLFGVLQQRTIKIEDANIDTFKLFLRYIYTGQLNISIANMFELAYLAKKYLIAGLTSRVAEYFKGKISERDNFWDLFHLESIRFFDDDDQNLLARLLLRLQRNPKLLASEQFLATDENIISQLVRCSRLDVKEFDIYQAVVRWTTNQCKQHDIDPTTDNMRRFVKGFIHSLRLPTLKITELIGNNGINTNNLLTKEEKAALLCYVGGQLSVPVPFVKLPRLNSPELLFVTSARCSEVPVDGRSTTASFTTKTAYRFAGVSCVINTKGVSAPKTIVFELRCNEPEMAIYSFEWVSRSVKEVQGLEIFCRAHDLIPIYANTIYEIIALPSAGVAMHMFKGDFVLSSDEVLKCGDVHGFMSFDLLQMY